MSVLTLGPCLYMIMLLCVFVCISACTQCTHSIIVVVPLAAHVVQFNARLLHLVVVPQVLDQRHLSAETRHAKGIYVTFHVYCRCRGKKKRIIL